MKIIRNCFDSIGMFDSRIGDIQIHNEFMVMPVSNVQVDNTFPLNKSNHIFMYDYSYFILKNVFISERDVFFKNNSCHQELYRNDNIINYNEYDFELIDFINPECQYWNWKIKAECFFLGIPDYASSKEEYFENSKLDISHFYIKDFSFLKEVE